MPRTPRTSPQAPESPPAEQRGPDPGAAARFKALRAAAGDDSGNRILLATLKVRLARGLWTTEFTNHHPNLRIECLNAGEIDKAYSISDYWISAGEPGEWAAEIASYDDVDQVDSLATVGDGCMYRLKYRTPPVVRLYQTLRLPIQFPLRLQAGYITWEVVAKHSDFQTILAYARKVDPEAQIVSVRRRALRSHVPVLTDSQQGLLTEALSAGYFAVPRGISLTDLAKKLDRSKSSVSEGLAIIEKKLIESALNSRSLG
jgi:predicted DNA binding protein